VELSQGSSSEDEATDSQNSELGVEDAPRGARHLQLPQDAVFQRIYSYAPSVNNLPPVMGESAQVSSNLAYPPISHQPLQAHSNSSSVASWVCDYQQRPMYHRRVLYREYNDQQDGYPGLDDREISPFADEHNNNELQP